MKAPDHRTRLACLALAAAALATPAGAQGSPGTMTGSYHEALVPSVATQYYGRTAFGDFDGDLLTDIAILRGGTVEFVIGPGMYEARMTDVATANDLALAPAGELGPTDGLIVADAGGVHCLEWDGAAQAWSLTTIDGIAWGGARRMEVDLGGGSLQLYGLMSDKRAVRRLTWDGVSWTDQLLMTIAADVEELQLFDYDGDGAVELGVMTGYGLGIYEQDGSLLAGYAPGGVTSVSIARICQPGTSEEWLAWLLTAATGGQFLVTVGQNGLSAPAGMSPTPDIVAMSSGDVDNDGACDVMLSHTALHHMVLFVNRGDSSGPVFDYTLPASLFLVPVGPDGTPAPDNRAWPALFDVDADGDRDYCMPVQSMEKLFVGKNSVVDETLMEPALDDTDPTTMAMVRPNGADLDLELQIDLDAPLPAGATHLELVMWDRDDPATPTNPVAIERVLVPVSAGQDMGSKIHFDVTLTIPSPTLVGGSQVQCVKLHVWHQRLVTESNGVLTKLWPARIFAADTTPNQDFHAFLTSHGATAEFAIYDAQGSGQIDDQVGCGSELPCLPNYPDDDPPRVLAGT